MKKIFTHLLLLICINVVVQAQQIDITGTVTDASTSTPLPGVNVLIVGTTTGAVTDMDGKYTISANVGDKLTFSFIGYIDEQVTVSSQTNVDVQLIPDIEELEEVVVVGYGTMYKSDLTGSVASVSVSNTTESGVNSVNELLQGRAAGVSVISNSGVPGGAVSINIRGVGSMSANTQPLYVIDGVIMDGTTADITGDDVTQTNPLAFLSPDDIESIEILKDASATAIYGSRGANGVVLVTTKSGEKGKMQVNYSGSFSISEISKKLDVLDGPTYARYRNEMAILAGDTLLPYDGRNENTPLPDSVQWVDWQDEIYQTALSHKHRLSFSGGDDNSKFFTSLGYLNSEGIIKSTGLEKFDFRTNMSRNINRRLSIDANIAGSLLENDMTVGVDQFGGDKSMIGSILNTRPVQNDSLFMDGDIDPDQLGENNPYAWLNEHTDKTKEYSMISNFSLNVEIFDWLRFKSRLGINYRAKERARYWGEGLYRGAQVGGLGTLYDWSNFHYVFDNLLFINHQIDKHRFNGTIGVTYDHTLRQYNRYSASGFPDDYTGADALHGGAIQTIEFTTKTPTSYSSGLFRLNYGYGNRLSLTVTGRADGSSKFKQGQQWGFFPSAAAAYKLHNEPFIKNINAISNLKVRAGWGQVGNSTSSAYGTVTRFNYAIGSDSDGNTVTTLVPGRKGFDDYTWETSQQTNLGMDLGFLRNRITLTVDVYQRLTKNQLQDIKLPSSAGFDRTWVNLGKVENKGIEVDLKTVVVDGEFKVSLGGNFAINRNKIVELGRNPDEFGQVYYMGDQIAGNDELKGPVNIFMEGQPVGVFWGYKTDGIIQDSADANNQPLFFGTRLEEGNIKFVDHRTTEADSLGANINAADMQVIGDPNPDFTLGFYGNFGYKGFGLDFQFTGVFGRDVYNANKARLEDHSKTSFNKFTEAYEQAWRVDKPSNTYPRLDYQESTWGPIFTDRWVEDASYVRLKYITLSYQTPLKKSAFIQNLKLFVTGNNLLTFTNYSGYDPEVDSFSWDATRPGLDFYSFPGVRSYLFGINVTFK